MATYKSNTTIDFKINMEMTEAEARALEAITGYGFEDFLEMFYTHLGSHYLKPHENGAKLLFQTIREDLPAQLTKIDEVRKIFGKG